MGGGDGGREGAGGMSGKGVLGKLEVLPELFRLISLNIVRGNQVVA